MSGSKKFSFLRDVFEAFNWCLGLFWKAAPLLILTAAVYSGFFGIRNVLYADPYFQINVLKVFPKGVLTSDEYTGFEREIRGRSLLGINLERLSSVIKSNPRVKRVSILRHLPAELEIFIVPRDPIASLALSPKGEFYTIDDDGVVMAISKSPAPDLIQFSNYYYSHKKLDVFDKYRDASIKALPVILKAFRENEVTKEEIIRTISMDPLGNFSIGLMGGPTLRVCDDIALGLQKLSATRNLLAPPERGRIVNIDLCLNDVVVERK